MNSLSRDFDLVLAAPEPFVGRMAQDLLASRGIPSFLHGRPVIGDFGFEVPSPYTGPDLYVPRGARNLAQRILRETWDDDSLARIEFRSTLP